MNRSSAEQTDDAFTLLEADEPPGFGPPMHIHREAAEAFYVVAGEYIIFVRDEEYAYPAGSFIFIPAGVPHGFRVGPQPSRTHDSRRLVTDPLPTVSYYQTAAVRNRGFVLDGQMHGKWEFLVNHAIFGLTPRRTIPMSRRAVSTVPNARRD